MLDREKLQRLNPKLFLLFAILGFSALWYSPFLVSICTGVLTLLSLPNLKLIWQQNKSLVSVMVCFFLFGILDVIRNNSEGIAVAKLGLLVGFVFVLLSAFYYFRYKPKYAVWFVFSISAIVLIINIIAVGNYLLNKAMYDALLLQSKSIPILNMHHIHFGVINAITLFLLFGVLRFHTKSTKLKNTFYPILIIIFICFHILSSRTGIIAFYGGALVSLLIYAIYNKQFKVVLLGGLLISISFGTASIFSTSFKNKISNSIEDFKSIQTGGEEINFKSMAMRLEASKMCIELIKENPVIGVGAAKQDLALQQIYIKQNTALIPINRVGPHNQWLEFGVKYGVSAIILLLVFFILMVLPFDARGSLFYGFLTVICISMLFESLLERQASIYFISLFLGVAHSLFNRHIYEI